MPPMLGQTINIKVNVNTSDAVAEIQKLSSALQNVKSASANINLNSPTAGAAQAGGPRPDVVAQVAAIKNLETSINNFSRSVSTAGRGNIGGSGGAVPPGGRAAPPGGGGGKRPPPIPPQQDPQSGFLGSGARGGREGFGGRVRSVAEFTVAATAVRGAFNAFGKGLSVVAEVNQEMAQLNKVLNTSKENLNDLKSAAVSTAKEFGKSTTDVLKGFRIFAQQGLPADEVKKLGRTVALASNVSEFGTENLSELLTTGIKTYGKGVVGDSGEKLVDKLLAVEGNRAVSESDLAEVIKRIGPQAQTAGISLDELNALTTIMKERTRAPAEEIGTAFRFIIKNLQDPKNIKELQNFEPFKGNVRFTTATGDLRNTFDVLQDISKVFPSLTRQQKAFVASSIGDTRFSSKVIATLEGFGDAGDIVKTSQNAQGEAFKRNQIVMQSLSKQYEKTGASFEGFALALGDNFVGPATTLLKTLQLSLDTLTKMSSLKLTLGGLQTDRTPASEQRAGISVGNIAALGATFLAFKSLGKLLGAGKMVGAAVTNLAGRGAVGAGAAGLAGMEGVGAVAGAGGLGLASRAAGGLGAAGSAVARRGILGTLGEVLSGAFLSKIISKKAAQSAVQTQLGQMTGRIGLGVGAFAPKVVSPGLLAGAGTRAMGALGAAAGPVGFVATTAISLLVGEAITRALESSRERVERKGIISQSEKSDRGLNLANSIKTYVNNLASYDKQVLSGEKTQEDVNKLKKKDQADLKKLISGNQDILSNVEGVNISSQGELSFDGSQGDITTNTKALKGLTNGIVRSEGVKKVTSDLVISLDSFGERLDSATEDSTSEASLLISALRKNPGEQFTLGEREALNNRGKITNELLAGDFNKLNETLAVGGSEALEKGIDEISSSSRDAITTLLRGSTIRSSTGFAADSKKSVAQELMKGFSTNIKDSFSGDDVKNIDKIDAAAGDFAKIVTKSGQEGFGKVVEQGGRKFVNAIFTDQLGNKFQQLIGIGGKGPDNRFKEFQIKAAARPNKEEESDFSRDLIRTGFGAGKVINAPEFNAGASSLLDLSDRLAGTFKGFSAGGSPQFNTGLQRMFGALATKQDDFATRTALLEGGSSEGDETTSAAPAQSPAQKTADFKKDATVLEAGGILAKAVDSFGRVVKSFESAVQKFQQFQNRQQAAERIGITRTGALAKFGGEVPGVNLGKETKDLNASERAFLQIPNSFKQLSNLQFQLQNFRDVSATIEDERYNVSKTLSSSSNQALGSLDAKKLSDILEGTLGGLDQVTKDSALRDIERLGVIKPGQAGAADRQTILGNLQSAFSSLFDKKQNNVLGLADQAGAAAAPLEANIKTATALSQLQISAEQAADALKNLERFGGLFQNLSRAKGEGPFGALGGRQPSFFVQNGGKPQDAAQLNFRGQNEFEMQRDIIRRRRNGENVLDENYQPLGKLSEDQARAELRKVNIAESNAQFDRKQLPQREQLAQNESTAKQFIVGIQEVLTRGGLTSGAETGLKALQSSLVDLSNRPEKEFINNRGEINTKPFDVLKQVPGELQKLIPQDILKNATKSQIESLQNKGLISPEKGAEALQAANARDLSPVVTEIQTSNNYLAQLVNIASGKPTGAPAATAPKALTPQTNASVPTAAAAGNLVAGNTLNVPAVSGPNATSRFNSSNVTPLAQPKTDLFSVDNQGSLQFNKPLPPDGYTARGSFTSQGDQSISLEGKEGNKFSRTKTFTGSAAAQFLEPYVPPENLLPPVKGKVFGQTGTNFMSNVGSPFLANAGQSLNGAVGGSYDPSFNYVGKSRLERETEKTLPVSVPRDSVKPSTQAKATQEIKVDTKQIDTAGKGFADKVFQAINDGAKSLAEVITTSFGPIADSLKNMSSGGGGDKTVGGKEVITKDMLQQFLTEQNERDVTHDTRLETLDRDIANLNDTVNTKTGNINLISEKLDKVSAESNLTFQNVTTLSSRINEVEGSVRTAMNAAEIAISRAGNK